MWTNKAHDVSHTLFTAEAPENLQPVVQSTVTAQTQDLLTRQWINFRGEGHVIERAVGTA